MAQVTDWDVDNAGGSAVRAQLNGILAALQGCSSGAAAPSPTVAGMLWFDTTNLVLKVRNNANSAWVSHGPETVAATTVRGNSSGSAGAIGDITMATLRTMLGFSQSLGSSGWLGLPGGLYLQWVLTTAIGSGVNQAVTLPMTFPTAIRAAFAQYVNTSSNATVGDNTIAQIRDVSSPGSVTVRNLTAYTASFYLFAIGD